MKEIQDLSKQIGFNNLTYHYKGKLSSRNFIALKTPLDFYKNMKLYNTRKSRRKTKKV